MVTGPNMSGKSALLRQTALISLMAQSGAFVPAKHADLGILDRIFTRVGASDNISSGESTFMVEMNETAAILNNLTPRSLVLLDEIGRGTSTYDGVSIAWAIAEHLHETSKHRPLTLFATHYHELNDMSQRLSRIVNVNVSVKEMNGKVVFLRKLAPGGSNHSFGIHVARLAGMPRTLVLRAEDVLESLESARSGDGKSAQEASMPTHEAPDLSAIVPAAEGMQMSFFQLDDPALESIRDQLMEVDIDHLTPVQALMKLHEIKATLSGQKSLNVGRRGIRVRPSTIEGLPRHAPVHSQFLVRERAVEHVHPVAIKLRSLIEGTSLRRPPTPKATGRRGCSSPCWPSEKRGRGCWARNNG